MRTPIHFSTSTSFRLHVLRCALRYLESYQQSIRGKGKEKLENYREIQCVEAEIRSIEYGLRENEIHDKQNTK